jgi:hypothetical protein
MELIVVEEEKLLCQKNYELQKQLSIYPLEGIRIANYFYDPLIKHELLSFVQGDKSITLFNNEINVLYEMLKEVIKERDALNGEFAGKKVICINFDYHRHLTNNLTYTVEWDNGSDVKIKNDEDVLVTVPKRCFRLKTNDDI